MFQSEATIVSALHANVILYNFVYAIENIHFDPWSRQTSIQTNTRGSRGHLFFLFFF